MNTKILEKLGKQIKTIRLGNQFTQEYLAEKVGVHPTYIGKIESGKNNISVKVLYKISKALNVKLKDLFDFE